MANDDHNVQPSTRWTGKMWLDGWSDRHPVLAFIGCVVLLAYFDLPKRHFDSTFEFAVAIAIAVVLVSAVFGSAFAGLYLFVGLVKMVAPERYETLQTTQKWYVRMVFGIAALASFAIGPALLVRGLHMIWGAP